jgi:hypothetical protein
MMRHPLTTAIVTLCAALGPAVSALAQEEISGPRARVPEPLTDVGWVAKGERISHDFLIRNQGDEVLEITSVRPECSCSVVEFTEAIAPGETGTVNLLVDTANQEGGIVKGATVYTNDPSNPRLRLAIKAQVRALISVSPGYARFIVVQKEAGEGTITQTIWAEDGNPLEIVDVESPHSFLQVTYREAGPDELREDVAGKQWKVDIHLSNEAPVGALTGRVEVHTTHPKQKTLFIPVSGFVRPVFAITPAVADFGAVELAEPVTGSLLVRNFATESIELTGVESGLRGVDAAVAPLEEGRRYEVTLTLTPELPKGPFATQLKIHTSSPKEPVLLVEVKGKIL